MPRSPSWMLVTGTAALLAAVGACTGDDTVAGEPDPTPPVSSPSTEPPRESDGVLTIGVLLPRTGDGATIGNSGIAAAQLAVDAINRAGGVLGEPVQIVTADEGATGDETTAGIDALLEQDVDAIVGPASSTVAVETLGLLTDAGVVTCSPTASAIALDNFPNRDLFFRTVPSDSLLAEAIAEQAQNTGVTTATVVYLDDAFGRPFADAVTTALEERRLDVVAQVRLLPGAADYANEASTLVESESGTVVVIADSEQGWLLLSALAQLTDQFAGGLPPRIIVNDALRTPPAVATVTALPEVFRAAIEGISPMGTPQTSAEPDGPFATNAFDCVNLIALAAANAGSDDPTDIAASIRPVANDGAGCASFEQCLEIIDGRRDVDYNGPGGLLVVGESGDPGRARVQVFRFDEEGLDVGAGSGRITD